MVRSDIQWMILMLAVVGTQYQFYHHCKLTKSTKICQFRWFGSKPELLLINGLFLLIVIVSAINQQINQVLNSIFNPETHGC